VVRIALHHLAVIIPLVCLLPPVPACCAPPSLPDDAASLDQRAVDSLRVELTRHAGTSAYIVIDRTRNHLVLRDPDSVLVDAICATGSGKILFGEKSSETWHFKTPRRVFSIQKKVLDPIWKKPNWAFVEKNQKAPVLPWEFSRLDGTTLGAFGLELQNSYAIHGTLYPVLLGRNITHGCVRLNDTDLATTFRLSEVGTRVYIH
jgi:L,D-transpeptidase ErfK/SrfK